MFGKVKQESILKINSKCMDVLILGVNLCLGIGFLQS